MNNIENNLKDIYQAQTRNSELEKSIYQARLEIKENKEKIRKLNQENFRLAGLKD